MPHNFKCELISFEVVPFTGGYDVVLGRTAFAKFMAIPNYAYMQLKMPGPRGVITVHGNHLQAIQAESGNLEEVNSRVKGQAATARAPRATTLPRYDWGHRPPECPERTIYPDHPEYSEHRPTRRSHTYW